MILSASGWRKVFAESGDENDAFPDIGETNRTLAALAADTFADYILEKKQNPAVVLGIDTRPTGPQIAEIMIRVLMARKIAVSYAGIIAAPEIMAYSRTSDAFVYISASHNPIGHNGIKFGLNDGGVLGGEESKKLISAFEAKCSNDAACESVRETALKCSDADLDWVFAESVAVMREADSIYRSFAKTVISGSDSFNVQNKFFAEARKLLKDNPTGVVCDMNGSARTLSIDEAFLNEVGIDFFAINKRPGEIKHEIIPEPENLIYVAKEMERLHLSGKDHVKLGYMPDCDGDRGNFIVWNEKTEQVEVLKAQDVFALSVLAELSYSIYLEKFFLDANSGNKVEKFLTAGRFQENKIGAGLRLAVAANCPTSMRIEEIASAFNAEVFRAEVGEANVVNLAKEKRNEGYQIRILGEGSNGGNITYPAAVRDPLNTLFALLKLMILKDIDERKGLFHLWCEASGQMEKYESCKDNYSLIDIIETLPKYTTTGVSEKRAVLHIETKDHGELKAKFQRIFENQWNIQKDKLREKFGFDSYEVIATNGTKETRNVSDYSVSGKGGLKIVFFNEEKMPLAFIWMRGSGTEPVFRVMCDVKGNSQKEIDEEKKLLEWETKILLKADNQI